MSAKKRGGARLDRSKTPQKSARPPEAPTSPARQAEPPARKKPGKGVRIAIIAVAVVAAAILAAVVWYKQWAQLPEVPMVVVTPTPGPAVSATPDPITGEIPSAEPIPQPVASDRKKDFYTFIVIGRDTASGSPDTIMLVAYDIPNQRLAVMNFPRDTMVNARHPNSNRKLNAVWNLGPYYASKDDNRKGMDYLKEAMGDLIGFTPDFYVTVNWNAFGRLVDAIGGVYFDVPRTMQYDDPDQDLHIDQAAGYRLLWGKDAMEVVRWRHNNSYSAQYPDGDLGRIRTQQALLKEIVKKCLQIQNVANINKFAEIFAEEVETDLTTGNLVAFAERAILGGLSMDNVTFLTAPVDGLYVGSVSYVQLRPDELLPILNEHFNPSLEDLTVQDLDILQYSGSQGYYTSGGSEPRYKSTPKASVPKTSASPSPSPSPKPTPSIEPSPEPPVTDLPEDTPAPTPETAPEPTPDPGGPPEGIPFD